MAEDYARDGEVPVHPVRITGFELSPTPVTNRQFAAFVEATGYQTDAERFDSSAVFHLALQARSRDILGTAARIGWNRLLQIEARLGSTARFAGWLAGSTTYFDPRSHYPEKGQTWTRSHRDHQPSVVGDC